MRKRQVPFDSFAVPVKGFNLEGQESSKSWVGFLFTIGLLGAVFGVFISQLVSMFSRASLSVSVAEQGVATPEPTNLKSVTMAFGVMQRQSPLTSLVHNVDFKMEATLVTLTFYGRNPRQLYQQAEPIPITECTEDYFGDMLDEVEDLINIQDIYCIPRSVSDDLLTIQGQIGSDTYKFIQVTAECIPVDPVNNDYSCSSSFVTSNIFFMYGASYMNVSNYENPISITPTAILDRADRFAYHEKSIYITPREIVTDQGLVFSSLHSETDYIVSEGQSVIEGLNVLTPSVFSFQIKMSPNKIVVNRSYDTILDVLASVTGIASTITLVFGIILKPYVELMTHNRIMHLYSEKHQPGTFLDWIKALFCIKSAKKKMQQVKDEEDWINQNMDMIYMLKNWSDLQRMKKLVEPAPICQELRSVEIRSYSSEKVRISPTNDIELGQLSLSPQEQF